MPLKGAWFKLWIYLGFVCGCTKGARPRFDTSTDMGLVLVPADAEIESVIFRLRATDQDADFPLIFDVAATVTPVVRIDNLPCTLYNKVCQANVVLTRRLIPGRLHDFAVRVRDSKGDSNSMQATISVTNATTPRDTIFPHIPSLIMVPENTRPGTELDYLLVRANQWSGKPVYIELWQPKELFTIRQRQTPSQTRGIITLIGELDFETQSMYTLTMYATDPYTEPGKDTRNIAGLNVVVVVQDVQDVPPIFTLAPPLTKINNSVQPGDVVLRVHAEDGDKGVPREITYGLVSEGNPFTLFFNISETTGEIILARPLEELTKITHVGAPVVLSVVAEEIRRVRDEPPAQATVVEVGLLLGEPGNSPPYFESDNYVATIDENPEPGTVIKFPDAYSTKVRDEDIGKAGVFALKLDNNNGTFEITPTVAERTADFIVTVRDNTLIDYEIQKSLTFMIRAQEVGPATNLSTSVPVTIFLRDVNDNPPIFDEDSYEATLSENVTAGTRVVQVHATDRDTGLFGSIRYTGILGEGGEAFAIDPDTGLITVAMGSSLDREMTAQLQLSVEARDENGKGNRGVVPLIINLLDVNDNAPVFEKDSYEFMLNSDLTNFTRPAFIKASDGDAEPPNNVVRYELIHGNYENKFDLNEITGELILRSPITKIRRKKQSVHEGNEAKLTKPFRSSKGAVTGAEGGTAPSQSSLVNSRAASGTPPPPLEAGVNKTLLPDERNASTSTTTTTTTTATSREKREAEDDTLYTLTARAYDLGVPHLHSEAQIRIIRLAAMESRIVMFVVPGEHPDIAKTTRTLTTITGGTVTVMEIRPYVPQNHSGNAPPPPSSIPMEGGKKSIVIARVDQKGPSSVVDIEKIREALAANGVGILNGMDGMMNMGHSTGGEPPHYVNNTIINNREVTLYKAENKLLFWLLIVLGLLILLALAILIICCICPGCPFYMEPRKRRVHSSETLVVRTDGRPRRHLHRKHPPPLVNNNWPEKKEAWSADPTRRNWQFNRRNTKQLGLASLPGDVAYISGPPNEMQLRAESLRLRDGLPEGYDAARARGEEIYVEDVDGQKVRGYDALDVDSLRRHELERGSDDHRQTFRYVEHVRREDADAREQHFYREGNAEVLRLVTRGEIGQDGMRHPGATLVVDGKDILLRRFIEDQKIRHDGSVHDVEAARSMESQPRVLKDVAKQEIILVPEKLELELELEHRQHVEELGPTVQRLVIDHSSYGGSRHEKETLDQQRESYLPEPLPRVASGAVRARERTQMVDEQLQSTVNTRYSYHDMELARQNALLTRLLLEREGRVVGAPVLDAASYLETQSLPGQVAIATQTDKTTATQTERQNRSRSDNDESEDDSRSRRKFRSKKRYGEYDSKRTRAFWMKSPIEEEENPSFDQKLNILRRKFEEVKDAKKMSLEPDVLREISDSLDGNGSSYSRGDASCREDEVRARMYRRSKEEASTRYKRLQDATSDGWQSSVGRVPEKFDRAYRGPDRKLDTNESTSSPEVYRKPEKKSTIAAGEKSPRKLPKKSPKKSTEPSFRILEKEITLLARKLSKFGDKKKAKDSTGSDSQEKNVLSRKESRRETLERSQKKRDAPHARDARQEESVKVPEHAVVHEKDAVAVAVAATKGRPKLKQQHTPVISTGSSEYEEAFERRKRQSSPDGTGGKQKPVAAPTKPKRVLAHGDKPGEARKALDQASEKKKFKDTRVESVKVEKSAKAYARPQKLGVVGRREHVQEDAEAKASKPEVKGGSSRGSFPGRDVGSRDVKDADVAERTSTRGSRKFSRKVQERAAGRTLDDVEELSREDPPRQRVVGREEESAGEAERACRIDIEKVATKITSNIMEAAVDEVKEEESAISLKEMLMNFAELEHGGDEGAAPSSRVTDEKRLPSPPLGSASEPEETRKLEDNSQASDFSTKETTTAVIRHGELEENEVSARPPSGTGGPRREATAEPTQRKLEPEEPAGSRDRRVTEVEKTESTKPEVASSLEDPVLERSTEGLGSRSSGDPVTSGRGFLGDSETVRSAGERTPRVGVQVSRSNGERDADRKESAARDEDTDRGIPSATSKVKDPAESPGLSAPLISTRVEGADAGGVASETREIQMLTTDARKASTAGSGDDLEKPAESPDLAERPGALPATSPVSTGDIKKKADAEEAIKSEKFREIVKRGSESAESLKSEASSPPPLETAPREPEKIGTVAETTPRHLGDEAEGSVGLHKKDAISEGEAGDAGKLDKVQALGFEDNFVDDGRIGAGEDIPYIDEDLAPGVGRLEEGSNYDSDSSSGGSSDVSGKTTLKVAPYQTPRHSPRTTVERKRDEFEYQELKSERSDEAQGQGVLQVESVERDRSRDGATSDGTPVVNIDPARDPEGTETPQVPGFKVDSNFQGEAKSSDRAEPTSKDTEVTEDPVTSVTSTNELKPPQTGDEVAAGVRAQQRGGPTEGERGKALGEVDVLEGNGSARDVDEDERSSREGDGEGIGVESVKAEKQIAEKARRPQSEKTLVEKKSPRKEKRSSLQEAGGEERNVAAGTTHQSRQATRRSKEEDRERKKSLEQTRQGKRKEEEQQKQHQHQHQQQTGPKGKPERDKKTWASSSVSPPKIGGDIDTSKTQSKYMAWYKQKREEMEKKRLEMRKNEEEEQLPRWLRRSLSYKKAIQNEQKKNSKTPEVTPRTRRKIKPLVNVESEQLKAIVRQGRKLRKAEGVAEDPSIEIFASPPPPPAEVRDHHLIQHSEYKYEKAPPQPPFYLHPPPPPHPSPQLSPEPCESQSLECRRLDDDLDSGIAVSLQGAARLRHQQLLEKKSVFDIAYSEAAPSQLRADSTTPPS